MHLAIIIDDERLEQEQPLLHRLCVGLMAEGVQITRIVPDTIDQDRVDQGEQRIALASRIETRLRVLPWMRRDRLASLLQALDRSVPDVIHVVGLKAWAVGRDLAKAIDRPLLLDVWSLASAKAYLAHERMPEAAACVVPCRGLAESLRKGRDGEPIALVPMGVASISSPRSPLRHPESASIAVLGRCQDASRYQAALNGLAALVHEIPNLQIIMELRGPAEHDVWREAERLDLLANISAIGSAPLYRELLIACDMLVMPEATSELRSIMLECMAAGMPVISVRDDVLDMLEHQRTALIVQKNSTEAWTDALLRLITGPKELQAIGRAARERIEQSHRSSDQVRAFIDLLEHAVSGGSHRFAAR